MNKKIKSFLSKHFRRFAHYNADKNLVAARPNYTPLISVIVTSYNYEEFIYKTLTSIGKQTYKNFEIIVVDDGSKDNSINVINRFAERHSQLSIYVYENKENKGLIYSMKLAISKAHGDYIAFCESDDYWRKNYLKQKVRIIQRYNEAAIISNNIQLFGDKECIKIRQPYIDHVNRVLKNGSNNIDICHNQKMNYIPTLSAVMIKKDIIDKLNFNSPIPAWIDFWLYRQILITNKLLYCDKKLTFWRQHISYDGNQVSNEYDIKIERFIPESNKLLGIKNEE